MPHPIKTNILIAGGGPAALALAAELGHLGLSIRIVAPHQPQTFTATYGAWLDEWPEWAKLCLENTWSDVRTYLPQLTPILRPYSVLDNKKATEYLISKAGNTLYWTQSKVVSAEQHHQLWQIYSDTGEMWTSDLVIDATGHGGTLVQPTFLGGLAMQTAYGLIGRFKHPPISPGSMSWMDYRPTGLIDSSTFLYAMHLDEDRYLVEETSLIARPAPTKKYLKQRLLSRLAAQGTPITHIEADEWVAFPMNAQAPLANGILAFGATAGMVHPISGFQVASAFQKAPELAQILAKALEQGENAAQAGWNYLWPQPLRQARAIQTIGLQALLNLSPAQLPPFFKLFFSLPPTSWQAFLSPETQGQDLTRLMLQLFTKAPISLRYPLTLAAMQEPKTSVNALLQTFTKELDPKA